jgi:uncharacterized protein (TIGR02145 family)
MNMIKRIFLSTMILFLMSELYSQKYGSFTDPKNRRIYKTVIIGNQVWMTENLNVDKFRNGDSIPEAKTEGEWEAYMAAGKAAWCYYENDAKNGEKYGKLYNWYAVNDPRGLSPKGWHIPSDTEWAVLTDYLGGGILAGTKMKSTSGWNSYNSGGSMSCPNCKDWNAEYRKKVPCHMCKDTQSVLAPSVTHSGNGTNSTGFSGLPGGLRSANVGWFEAIGNFGYWWSSSEYNNNHIWGRFLYNHNGYVGRNYHHKDDGLSVRCLRD